MTSYGLDGNDVICGGMGTTSLGGTGMIARMDAGRDALFGERGTIGCSVWQATTTSMGAAAMYNGGTGSDVCDGGRQHGGYGACLANRHCPTPRKIAGRDVASCFLLVML
jgi:hypothetical protein